MTQVEIQGVVDEAVRRITDRFDPVRIILFGSYVNGSARGDSDLDILVIMHIEGSSRKMANAIDLALADRSIPMDVIVVTPEQFQRQKDMRGTIVGTAAKEGQVIYERAA